MFRLRKPSPVTIQHFLAAQAQLELTYPGVGATAGVPPPGFVVDHTRIKLGDGERVFRAAHGALERWKQFHLGWMEAIPQESSIKTGLCVALLARSLGLWLVNACRVVYIVDEADKFGYACGTLPAHVGSGEERFLVEWDREDGSVWYDILAFSRPRHWLARLGYPFMRRVQRRFRKESTAAMMSAVAKA